MNSNWRRVISVAVVLIAVTAFVQPFEGDAASRSNREDKITGTWRFQLVPKNCQTGVTQPPFDFIVSFARGGTLTEVASIPVFAPGQRSTGLGTWSHEHRNGFKSVSEAFILFDSATTPPGFKRGVQHLEWDIKVDGDQATIESVGQFLDTSRNVLATTCASGTGTRFENEDQD